jgi:hypothetical protein
MLLVGFTVLVYDYLLTVRVEYGIQRDSNPLTFGTVSQLNYEVYTAIWGTSSRAHIHEDNLHMATKVRDCLGNFHRCEFVSCITDIITRLI